jgi:hypothetical protein
MTVWSVFLRVTNIDETQYVAKMVNIYSTDGLFVALLLFVCTATYLSYLTLFRNMLFKDKKGPLSVFYKSAVVGRRLHYAVAALCALTGCYLIFVR